MPFPQILLLSPQASCKPSFDSVILSSWDLLDGKGEQPFFSASLHYLNPPCMEFPCQPTCSAASAPNLTVKPSPSLGRREKDNSLLLLSPAGTPHPSCDVSLPRPHSSHSSSCFPLVSRVLFLISQGRINTATATWEMFKPCLQSPIALALTLGTAGKDKARARGAQEKPPCSHLF